LTPPDPQLKGAWYPGGFNPCTYQVKTRCQNVPFKRNLRRYIMGVLLQVNAVLEKIGLGKGTE
jgi:hypothetical protein